MEKILIGKIVNVVGLKGEVKIYNYSDSTRAYEETSEIIVGDTLMEPEHMRMQKNMLVVKFRGVDSIDDAEKLRGTEVFITEEDLPPLAEGEYYVRDIIGMDVVKDDDIYIGQVTDVIQNTAQDILEIKCLDGKTTLIPKVDQFVLDINLQNKKIKVRLIDGLIE